MPTGGSGGDPVFDSTFFFPVQFKQGFTTLPKNLLGGMNVSFTDLSLDSLSATHITGGVTQDVVTPPAAPAGVQAFEAKYPEGSWNPSSSPKRGGFGFYTGDVGDFKFENANELLFSYAAYFPAGFQWVKGGKMPGPFGGSTAELAYGCSGGRQEGRDSCFSLRLMWRKDGMGEVYTYIPKLPENDAALDAVNGTVADADYGWSLGRGLYNWTAGGWTVVAERIKLNDVNGSTAVANGEIELFVNGVSKILAKNVIIRQKAETVFRGSQMQTFFGGSDSTWATPVDTEVYFAGVSAAIIA